MHQRFDLLLFGILLAVMATASPAEGAEPARVLLAAQTASDGTVRVTATVVDGRGTPVTETPISFKARTTFGWLTLVETSTDVAGRAEMTLPPALRPEEVTAEAGGEGTVRATILIGRHATSEPRIRPGRALLSRSSPQPGFISPYPVPMQVALFAVVLGGVWSIYAYVAWLLLQIRRAR